MIGMIVSYRIVQEILLHRIAILYKTPKRYEDTMVSLRCEFITLFISTLGSLMSILAFIYIIHTDLIFTYKYELQSLKTSHRLSGSNFYRSIDWFLIVLWEISHISFWADISRSFDKNTHRRKVGNSWADKVERSTWETKAGNVWVLRCFLEMCYSLNPRVKSFIILVSRDRASSYLTFNGCYLYCTQSVEVKKHLSLLGSGFCWLLCFMIAPV